MRRAAAPSATTVITTDAQAIAAAHRMAADLSPGAAARDRDRILPWDEIDRFVASGLWGITVPQAFGGAGVSAVTLAEVVAILSEADSSLAQIPQNHWYVLELLRTGGTEAQQRYFYGLALKGHRFGNALSETGRRDFQRVTRLVPQPDGHWRISGRKAYCTGAIYAHWIPVWAAREEHGRDVGYLAFVPRDAQGITVEDDWDSFGQRITGSGSVVLDQVQVRSEWIIPFQGAFDHPTPAGPLAQILHAGIDLGLARGAFAATLPFVRERARPWIDAKVERAADDPLTIERVGDIAVQLRAAEALLRRAGRFVDAAQAHSTERSVAEASIAVAEARTLTTTAALDAGSRLFELGGASSTLDQWGLDRFWRNARVHTLHDPVRWKYHAIGNFYLNDRLPPRHGAL